MRTRVQSLLHALLVASLPVSQESPPHPLSLGGTEKLELVHKLGFLTAVQANPTGVKTPRLGSQELPTE